MLLTRDQMDVFVELFKQVCDFNQEDVTNKLVRIYKIRINRIHTVRHRLLIFLLVNDILDDFIIARHEYLVHREYDTAKHTSIFLNASITNPRITFSWIGIWSNIFTEFDNKYNSEYNIRYLIEEPT